MLLSLIFTGLLAAQAQPAPPSPSHTEAAELAQRGEYEQALDAFRCIAVANPADHAARMWIGRLHLWMDNPELAEPVFRSVLLEHPARVDARVGLGLALVAQGRADEALEVLEPAEGAAPDNPDVIVALGRAHRQAGHTTRSLGYMERAAAMAPTMENRQLLEQVRFAHGHRVESTSFFETFSGPLTDTRSSDLTVNVRINDRLRVLGRGQVQRKFGSTEQRGGAGLEWRWMPFTTVATQVLIGRGNDILPETDAKLEIAHATGRAEWNLGYRFFEFGIGDVSVVAPAVTWYHDTRLMVGLRYALALTNFDLGGERTENHSGTLHGAYLVYPRVWATLAYARGVENFENLSPDRIGDFDANTVSGGVRIDLPSLTSLFGVYDHQWRSGGAEMNRFTISFAQRF